MIINYSVICFLSVCSHGRGKYLGKEEMGIVSYKMCILFQSLEKEGKNQNKTLIQNITTVKPNA